MEYTWKVTGLKTQTVSGIDGVIFQTYWTKTGKDENGNEGVFSGATPIKEVDVAATGFISFDQLTEEDVLGWIKAVVVGEYENHVNQQIQKQIDQKTMNITEAKMPWAIVEETTVAPSGTTV